MTEAFVDAALKLEARGDYGESFNIGSGNKTTIGEVAAAAKELYGIAEPPSFSMPERAWDVENWFANIAKAKRCNGRRRTTLRTEGALGSSGIDRCSTSNLHLYQQLLGWCSVAAASTLTIAMLQGNNDYHVRRFVRRLRKPSWA